MNGTSNPVQRLQRAAGRCEAAAKAGRRSPVSCRLNVCVGRAGWRPILRRTSGRTSGNESGTAEVLLPLSL